MLKELGILKGMSLSAKDGEFGEVSNFFFDDEEWVIRYIVVSSGSFFDRRNVVISPPSITQISYEQFKIWVNLTKLQLENSPDTDFHLPFSRRIELLLHDHFKLPPYWGEGGPWMIDDLEKSEDERQNDFSGASLDRTHLRSAGQIKGASVESSEGNIGLIKDLVIEDQTWIIRYAIVDIHYQKNHRSILLSPTWFESTSWEENKVYLTIPRDDLEKAPIYKTGDLVRAYEEELFSHFKRERYWPQETFPPSIQSHQDIKDLY